MKINKTILDACCGNQMFYFDKARDDVLTMDIRRQKGEIHGKKIDVCPDILGDFRDIPFKSESFYHVIFDPPHLIHPGENSIMYHQYGGLDKTTWREDIRAGIEECYRVLKPGGTLVFKWSEHDIRVSEVLKILPYNPLYGHRRGKTIWMVFVKEKK